MRRGFVLSFTLLIEKLSNNLNFSNFIDTIEKESVVSKSEKNHIKNCTLTGKVLMYRSILSLKNLDIECMLKVVKILLDLLGNAAYRILEESILLLVKNVFENIFSGYYEEFANNAGNEKKAVKSFEKIVNLIERMFLVHKLNLANIKGLTEISIFLMLNCFITKTEKKSSSDALTSQFKKIIESVVSKNILQNLTETATFMNFFTLIIKTKRDADFHIAFSLLLQNLKSANNFSNVINYWNNIIDNDNQQQFKTLSLKNYQLLIFKYSKFILENFFNTNMTSIFQIFDNTFFETLFTFTSDKKFKYINSIIETIMDKCNNLPENHLSKEEEKLKSDYCFSLLNIFGSNPSFSLSPNTNKNFFVVR
jgi:hypothetical protein